MTILCKGHRRLLNRFPSLHLAWSAAHLRPTCEEVESPRESRLIPRLRLPSTASGRKNAGWERGARDGFRGKEEAVRSCANILGLPQWCTNSEPNQTLLPSLRIFGTETLDDHPLVTGVPISHTGGGSELNGIKTSE